jgi:type IV secretory pathway VirB2 component (pilin)
MKTHKFWKKSNSPKSQISKSSTNSLINKLVLGGVIGLTTSSAFASLPFVGVITSLASDISGPYAIGAATILIVAFGLLNAFGEWGDGMKKLINVFFWMAIVFGVVAVINTIKNGG